MSQDLFDITVQLAREYIDGLPERRVGTLTTSAALRATLGGSLPDEPDDPADVICALARGVDPGLVATAGPRYFGFVIGGALPAAQAADWLTSVWDQNVALHVMSPGAAVVEQIVGEWIVDLLGLPATATFGLVSGTQMATFTALAAARHAVLQRVGWNVETQGLRQAPPVHVIVSEESHATVYTALRLLGIGTAEARQVRTDANGRMCVDALQRALDHCDGATIVCAQAGNVNTGATDPLRAIASLTQAQRAWLHVDGAFGLWAAASPRLRRQLDGLEQADSWATDAHKWLNTPYDGGIVIVSDPAAHRAAMSMQAAYLPPGAADDRDGTDWVPDSSRRARGFAIYAALRSLGRQGVRSLVERCCDLAARMATRLGAAAGTEILNEVVLNQVLVRFSAGGDDADARTRAVIRRVQQDGVCWAGGTVWHGRAAMRISVSNWSTTADDVDRAADAIVAAARSVSPRVGQALI